MRIRGVEKDCVYGTREKQRGAGRWDFEPHANYFSVDPYEMTSTLFLECMCETHTLHARPLELKIGNQGSGLFILRSAKTNRTKPSDRLQC